MSNADAETRELAGDPHAQAAVRAGEQAMAAGDWTDARQVRRSRGAYRTTPDEQTPEAQG